MPTLPNDPEIAAAGYDYAQALWDSTVAFARVPRGAGSETVEADTSHVLPWDEVSPLAQMQFVRALQESKVCAALAHLVNLAAHVDRNSRN